VATVYLMFTFEGGELARWEEEEEQEQEEEEQEQEEEEGCVSLYTLW
jgi:hypothetical protein